MSFARLRCQLSARPRRADQRRPARPATEGRARLDVDDDTWGWNCGAIFTLPSATRIGVSYRSQMAYSLTGDTKRLDANGSAHRRRERPDEGRHHIPGFREPERRHSSERRARASRRCELDELEQGRHRIRDQHYDRRSARRTALRFQGRRRASRWASDYKRNEQWTFRAGTAWDGSPVDGRRAHRAAARQRPLVAECRHTLATDAEPDARRGLCAPVRARHGHQRGRESQARPRRSRARWSAATTTWVNILSLQATCGVPLSGGRGHPGAGGRTADRCLLLRA